MITIEVTGEKELMARLDVMPKQIHDALLKKIYGFMLKLEAKVKQKLSGVVLHVRTGALRQSIHNEVFDSPNSITGIVYSTGGRSKQPPYAAIHEYGGTTKPHLILPVKAQALAFMSHGKQVFAARVNHPGSKIPARPYMRPSLEEMTPEIIAGLKDAAKEGLNAKR